MYKNFQANIEKSQKLTQRSRSSMLTPKKLKQEEVMNIILSTKVARSLSEPRAFLREASVCKTLIPKYVPIRPIFLPQHGSTMT